MTVPAPCQHANPSDPFQSAVATSSPSAVLAITERSRRRPTATASPTHASVEIDASSQAESIASPSSKPPRIRSRGERQARRATPRRASQIAARARRAIGARLGQVLRAGLRCAGGPRAWTARERPEVRVPASHELHETRFAANPDDRESFEFLEEHRFMQADWQGLAELYRRRQAAPSLANSPRQRAEIAMRLAQICEERLGNADAAIRAYTEAVQLEPKLRRALRQLRRIYEARGSWEAVLQLGEQEAALAESAEERARAFVVMADVWQRHLGDLEQAAELYARARSEGWSDARQASRSEPKASEVHQAGSRSEPKASEVQKGGAAATTVWPVPAQPKPAEPASPFGDDEFEFYPDLE